MTNRGDFFIPEAPLDFTSFLLHTQRTPIYLSTGSSQKNKLPLMLMSTFTLTLLSLSLRNRRKPYLIRSNRVWEMGENKWQTAHSHKSCSKSLRIHFNETLVLTKLFVFLLGWPGLQNKILHHIMSQRTLKGKIQSLKSTPRWTKVLLAFIETWFRLYSLCW